MNLVRGQQVKVLCAELGAVFFPATLVVGADATRHSCLPRPPYVTQEPAKCGSCMWDLIQEKSVITAAAAAPGCTHPTYKSFISSH